jgi:hypothetical protein
MCSSETLLHTYQTTECYKRNTLWIFITVETRKEKMCYSVCLSSFKEFKEKKFADFR